ncbi:hypothetical protein [Limnohabitans sp.]|uniref:hypothetical protein n=1 Tax=Limnohabitans sp. TaxID=1907725 RepID=UPI0037BEFE76
MLNHTRLGGVNGQTFFQSLLGLRIVFKFFLNSTDVIECHRQKLITRRGFQVPATDQAQPYFQCVRVVALFFKQQPQVDIGLRKIPFHGNGHAIGLDRFCEFP